jgi:alkaline phosphatase D
MASMTRRQALKNAAALGATLAWPGARASLLAGLTPGAAQPARPAWQERRDRYPQGVASADPHPDSVLLWTRRPSDAAGRDRLFVEVAEDEAFTQIISREACSVSAATDWTCRVLAGGLKPSHDYWYRFVDAAGNGSRIGKTRTAPEEASQRQVRFAFVSCQNVTQGACNAYRRMLWEDIHRPADEQLDFVLHLGDFVYEIVWYPEDRPQGMYDRRLRDIVRYPSGEKIGEFHVPTTVDDYRALYRGYLSDPDLQDARARWPFVCVWDNHEFSWKGWQTQQNFGAGARPAQTRKVAANQAWFEYQPARVVRAIRTRADEFIPPKVADAPLRRFAEDGLGLEQSNIKAVESLTLYRTLRWGRHVELIITDNRTYRSEPVTDHQDAAPFRPAAFPFFTSQDVVQVLDAGRTYEGGHAPDTIAFGGRDLTNPRKLARPQSMLGTRQKTWFLKRLGESTATWKLWGNSVPMLICRTDFQNLPAGYTAWPASGYAQLGADDWTGYVAERNEILDFVRSRQVPGVISIAGDLHAFVSGRLSAALPPKAFDPVAVEFVVGSVSAPGLAEAAEHVISKHNPLRPLYVYEPAPPAGVECAVNVCLMHGVRSALTLQQTHDAAAALAAGNSQVAPHLSFADVGGHGYAVVRAGADAVEVEFICLPRPLERSARDDGGPVAYRLAQRVERWQAGSAPSLKHVRIDGRPPLLATADPM